MIGFKNYFLISFRFSVANLLTSLSVTKLTLTENESGVISEHYSKENREPWASVPNKVSHQELEETSTRYEAEWFHRETRSLMELVWGSRQFSSISSNLFGVDFFMPSVFRYSEYKCDWFNNVMCICGSGVYLYRVLWMLEWAVSRVLVVVSTENVLLPAYHFVIFTLKNQTWSNQTEADGTILEKLWSIFTGQKESKWLGKVGKPIFCEYKKMTEQYWLYIRSKTQQNWIFWSVNSH